MADEPHAAQPEPEPGPALPHREPRSLLVHVLVDGAVAFLVMAFPAFLLGTGAVIVALGLALGVAVGLAPSTRRAEVRALAARDQAGSTDS